MAHDLPIVFTIGHSTHSLDDFLALLEQHQVTAVADVRAQPYSRLDHFNRESLSAALNAGGIDYVFLGRELGARREEPECYVDGQVVFERVGEAASFREGLARVKRGAENHAIALMCAEKEPLDCHRTILICRHLRGPGLRIRHILADGSLEDHPQTERRLVKQMGVMPTLFEQDLTEADLIERAYDQRGREIAHRPDREGEPP